MFGGWKVCDQQVQLWGVKSGIEVMSMEAGVVEWCSKRVDQGPSVCMCVCVA